MEKIYKNFRILVAEDYEKVSSMAADIIAKQVSSKITSVLGLATGSTPVGAYQDLARLNKLGVVDFEKVTTFNLDEYYPINKKNNQSYDYFMKDNLFNHINIAPGNTFIPNGEAADAAKECLEYESRIESAGGIDLQLLGIGLNGHIGFNEPADIFPQITHHVKLDDSTIKANSRFFDNANDVPKHALTMGVGTIMRSAQILLLISGAGKAEIAQKVIFGDITPKVPGTALQLHRSVTVILDKPAAEKVTPML